MVQNLITIVALVKDEHEQKLRSALGKNDWKPIPFDKLPSVHFSSMVLTEANQQRQVFFVWESNFDGPIEAFVNLAVRVAWRELSVLYENCDNFDQAYRFGLLRQYLKERVVKPKAYHIGAPALSARRVKAEAELVEKLETFIDRMEPGSARFGDVVQEYLQQSVTNDPDFRWAETPEGRLSFFSLLWRWVSLGLPVVVSLLSLPLLPVLAAWLRWREGWELADRTGTPDAAKMRGILRREDFGVQNHLANVTEIKPGRGWLARLVLWSSYYTARVQTKGKLGGIPGIFFAHWSLIDNDTKMLFVSNYSGGWDSYLDDFIDIASWGLTPVWSNTVGFPKTRLLAFGGSRNRTEFKNFVRNSQVETLVWHRAYPELTVENVNRNSAIRDGLFRQMGPAALWRWLRLL